jgi:hypothetical protein
MPQNHKQRVASKVVVRGDKQSCCSSSCGGCKCSRYKFVYTHGSIAIRGNCMCMYREIHQRDMAEEVIDVSMKQDLTKWFCEVVSNINRSVESFEMDQVSLHLFTEGKVFNINVSSACCGFLRVAHCRASIVIFVCNSRRFLGNVKVPQDTAYE